MIKDLHLNLKGVYFDQIAQGTKTVEYRTYNDYWKKRLEGQEYRLIYIKRGYPKRDDHSKILIYPWNGCKVTTIEHKEFGGKVFAIPLRV